MVTIRLSRKGKRNAPFYRIVATEKTVKRGGKPLEVIGFYNPQKEKLELDKSLFDAWVKKGAKVSRALEKLIETNGKSKSKKKKKE